MDDALAQKLSTYQTPQTAKDLVKQTQVLVLVGPTGAGKDSIKDKLLATGKFHHIISHTTRKPRINNGVIEQDGREYHFIDKQTAVEMLDGGGFIEAKIYSGNLYGTSVAEIQAAHDEGKIAMTDIEVQGVAEYKQLDPSAMAVFLLPPSFDEWQARLQRRYGDVMDIEDARLRMQTALEELDQLLNTDYYVAVINDDMNKAYQQILTVVESAEHTTPDEPEARAIAKRLAEDINKHLQATPSS